MKIFKKLICILICIALLFTVASAVTFAKGSEAADSSTYSFFDDLIGFLKSIAERVKRVLGIGYDKPDVLSYCKNAFMIPGLEEDFVPQGLCYVEKLSLYAVSGYVKGDNSRIYLVNDKTGEAKKLILKDFDLHAGGIASYNGNVYVSAGGNEKKGGHIYYINADTLSKAKDGDTVSFEGRFQVPVRASALYASDDILIVAEFYEYKSYKTNKEHHYKSNSAWACGYKLPLNSKYKKDELLVPDVVLSIPDKVQGLSITDSGKVVFSTSYGRKNDSVFSVYAPYEEWKSTTVKIGEADIPLYVAEDEVLLLKTKMPPMTEGVDFYGGSLYVLFESGAKIYSDAKVITEYVWKTDVEKMLQK